MISISGINIRVVDRKDYEAVNQAKPGATREGSRGWGPAGVAEKNKGGRQTAWLDAGLNTLDNMRNT